MFTLIAAIDTAEFTVAFLVEVSLKTAVSALPGTAAKVDIANPADPVLVSHVANIAADLGADIVKVPMASPAHEMVEVVASSPLPIVVAGGAGQQSAADFALTALEVGCRGLAVGRRVFTSIEPRKTVHELARIVHQSEFGSSPVSQPRMAGIS